MNCIPRLLPGSLWLLLAVVTVPVVSGAQTNFALRIHSETDQAKVVSWDSAPGILYTVESAEDLGPASLQELKWVTREVEYPSQGTNTIWMDVGDPTWIPRLHHPRLNFKRFYRVVETGTNSLVAPTVNVTLFTNNVAVSSNQAASGFLEIRFSVDGGTNADMVSEILVFVDGQVVSRGGSYTTNAWVNTTEWPNASHRIWVTAKTTDAADTTTSDTNWNSTLTGFGSSVPLTVSFDNYIHDFFVASPFFIPEIDGDQEISASFAEESYWRLWVLQSGQTPVSLFEGTNSSLYVAWDGTDSFGNKVWNGYYDYLIEARPTRLGPFESGFASMSSFSGASANGVQPQSSSLAARSAHANSAGLVPAFAQFPTPAQFGIPPADRNPHRLKANPEDSTNSGTISSPVLSESVQLMVMPEDASAVPVPLELYPPGFDLSKSIIFDPTEGVGPEIMQAAYESQGLAEGSELAASSFGPEGGESSSLVEDTQYTSTPIRVPGLMFKGFAGVFGTAYQGHHVKWTDVGFFAMPSGAHGFTSTGAPWGRLRNAGNICNQFTRIMTASGWRRSFQLADENFRWPDLKGCATGDCVSQYGVETAFGGRFRSGCDFGLLVGHMTAANSTPSGASHSYYPFWNPTYSTPLGGTTMSYSWIGLPEMDFGQSASILGGPSYLKWMGLYGCNSLRLSDVNDMWTKFLLPMPPNMRVLLGSDSTVYIAPDFGSALADNLNGLNPLSLGSPMTVIESWYDAGNKACAQANKTRNPFKRPGPTTLTAVFRDPSIFGDPGTANDTIWSYPTDINLDWVDIDWDSRPVWP